MRVIRKPAPAGANIAASKPDPILAQTRLRPVQARLIAAELAEKILRMFARSAPDFVLKGRCADLVRLDSQALEQEMGFDVGRGGSKPRSTERRLDLPRQ
jgi:hypothetical protein